MQAYEAFKRKVFYKTGIDLSLYKERQMKRRIESLIKRCGKTNYDDYFALIDNDKEHFDQFINFLTINVSEFYRNSNQWTMLKNEVIPYLMQERTAVKVWSAACSTGEEPYSLVMTLSNFFPLDKIKIFAADIDLAAIEKAKQGIYTAKSIKNVPLEYKRKYFTEDNNLYKIKDEIKNCVEFKQMNLLSDSYPRGFDLIICRNVMIYFTDEAKNDMYRKFSDSLSPGGVLFIGSTEQIINPEKFNFEPMRTFFYKKI